MKHKEATSKILDLMIRFLKDCENGNVDKVKYINDIDLTIDEAVKKLNIDDVSKSVAKQYAEFCVRCDREGLPLLKLDDYIKQYCC